MRVTRGHRRAGAARRVRRGRAAGPPGARPSEEAASGITPAAAGPGADDRLVARRPRRAGGRGPRGRRALPGGRVAGRPGAGHDHPRPGHGRPPRRRARRGGRPSAGARPSAPASAARAATGRRSSASRAAGGAGPAPLADARDAARARRRLGDGSGSVGSGLRSEPASASPPGSCRSSSARTGRPRCCRTGSRRRSRRSRSSPLRPAARRAGDPAPVVPAPGRELGLDPGEVRGSPWTTFGPGAALLPAAAGGLVDLDARPWCCRPRGGRCPR